MTRAIINLLATVVVLLSTDHLPPGGLSLVISMLMIVAYLPQVVLGYFDAREVWRAKTTAV